MNVVTSACAASGFEVDWHSINWGQCHQQVRRLQARIVKAIQEGRWGKVKALQWLLTHSFSGKAIAVKRVTENKGKKTSGVDGKTWSTPKAKSQAMLSLRRRGYQPLPLRRRGSFHSRPFKFCFMRMSPRFSINDKTRKANQLAFSNPSVVRGGYFLTKGL
ncbi:reverse transcriptase-like protein [Methylomonas methanica]|uniref:Reverse transcriptase N-terminal domain-containing protein n=2 Tax=Methylomonas TaxID=416 RepID=A0A140E547_9GAMM|nr:MULTISPECIES: reverse transcriptase N-terminal domain-containing protein [Methylomonas]AMK75521.1 hypothetical protein JT25_003285 [Methylomonas denitrificans]OAI01852.1 hypothetical protein A1342_21365 [Methylomonas methanica]TCV80054.1 reverse transcriptase-like protein [Methylomonas methanica]